MEAIKMMSSSDEYIEGFHDREFGYKDRNPYKRHTQDFLDYQAGWYAADEADEKLSQLKLEYDERD